MEDMMQAKQKSADLFEELLAFFMERTELNKKDLLAMYLAVDRLHYMIENFMITTESPSTHGDLEMIKGVLRRETAKIAEELV